MKTIIKVMGGMVIAGIVAISLFIILSNVKTDDGTKGLINIMGESASIKEPDFSVYTDDDAVMDIIRKPEPQVIFNNSMPALKKGVTVDLLSYFNVKLGNDATLYSATDSLQAGAPFSFKVNSIQFVTQNTDVSGSYHPDTGEMVFQKRGLYSMNITVKDTDNKTVTVIVDIPVGKY